MKRGMDFFPGGLFFFNEKRLGQIWFPGGYFFPGGFWCEKTRCLVSFKDLERWGPESRSESMKKNIYLTKTLVTWVFHWIVSIFIEKPFTRKRERERERERER